MTHRRGAVQRKAPLPYRAPRRCRRRRASRGQWLHGRCPRPSCAAEVKPIRSRAPLRVNHPECTLPQRHLALLKRGVKPWLSPRNAVAGVGVTVPRAVTRMAAVFMKPPVSQHAAVTAGASDTRLTSALPAAGVTRRAASGEDRAQGVAGTSCRAERHSQHLNIYVRAQLKIKKFS